MNSLHSALPHAHNEPNAAALNAQLGGAVEAFASAFMEAQYVVSLRSRIGPLWRFRELTTDRAAKHMEVVDAYIQPILERAIAKNKEGGPGSVGEKAAEEDENETLLDHLVKQTDGERAASAPTWCDGVLNRVESFRPGCASRRDVEHSDRWA